MTYKPPALRAAVLGLLLASLNTVAGAQQLGDLDAKSKLSAAERAERDANKVFQWIRINADKAAAAEKAAAAAERHAADKERAEKLAAEKAAEKATAADRAIAAERASAARLALAKQGAKPEQTPAPTPAPMPTATAAAMPAAAPTATASVEPSALDGAKLAAASPVLQPPAPATKPAPAPKPEPEPEVPLNLIEKIDPEFPRSLMSSVREGVVEVRFTVQPNGTVTGAEAVKTSHRKLASAAVDAVSRWRFSPLPKAREATVEIGFRAE